MARRITLVLLVVLGLFFLSRSCTMVRPGGPVSLMHGRIVDGTGTEMTTRFVAIDGGKIADVSLDSDDTPPLAELAGAREIDVTGLYVAATTFDRSTPTVIDGIRHVWIGQMRKGDPGDVVIMHANPGRLRPGYIPETDMIVGAVVDGRYYTGVEIRRRR